MAAASMVAHGLRALGRGSRRNVRRLSSASSSEEKVPAFLRNWFERHEVEVREDKPLIPAATVVLLRDASRDGVETLMLQRNSKLSFADGMWVFPGGRIDAADYKGTSDEALAARSAAIREAQEEASITGLESDELVHFAHWLPPAEAPKYFSTWFFVARAPRDEEVIVDQGEIVEAKWMAPKDVLKQHADQRLELLPPTWMTLWSLCEYTSTEQALNELGRKHLRVYATRMRKTEEGIAATWEGDAAYNRDGTANPDTPGPRHRLVMRKSGGWKYEFEL